MQAMQEAKFVAALNSVREQCAQGFRIGKRNFSHGGGLARFNDQRMRQVFRRILQRAYSGTLNA